MELKKTIIINLGMVMLLGLSWGIAYYVHIEDKDNELVLSNVSDELIYEIANPFYEEVVVESSSVVLLSNNNVENNIVDLNNWKWPTNSSYTITSYYGYRWGELHDAIDIYSGYGSSVYAANNGTVVAAQSGCVAGYTRCNNGRGNYVVIYHNGSDYYTMYMHLNSISVNIDAVVSGGEVIGKMGNTGNVIPVPNSYNPYYGTHLHFGAFVGNPLNGGYSFNPLTLY